MASSSASAVPPPSKSGAAKVLAYGSIAGKIPERWKAPMSSLFATKAIAGTALADDRNPDPEVEELLKANGKEVIRWHLGYTYAALGILDLVFRSVGVILWKLRFAEDDDTPRVSDTQREDISRPILFADLTRLAFTGSAAVIRCGANLVVLWHAFALLRPAWGVKRMTWIAPAFRILLVLWVTADFLQACIPNVPPDPTEHRITTVHIFFHQMSMYACFLVNLLLIWVLSKDQDADKMANQAAMWTLLIMISSHVYYTVYLFKGITGKATPVGWALVVELSFQMFNVGCALPPQIVAFRGELEKKWWPKFRRGGRVRENEDTSATTADKPLILSGPEMPEMEAVEEKKEKEKQEAKTTSTKGTYAAKRKTKKRLSEQERLAEQRAELLALNAQIRTAAAEETKVTPEAPEEPVITHNLPDEVKCSKCGETISADAKFCRACGAPRAKPEEQPAQQEQNDDAFEP